MFPALRVVAVLHALSLLLQSILAGLFLSGQDTAIDSHATNAMVVATLCLVQTALAAVMWRMKTIGPRIFAQSLVMLVLETIQIVAGFAHLLWLHIPLGAMLLAGVVTLMQQIMSRPKAAAAAVAVPVPAGAEAAE
jgi:hypothetical protein